MLKELLPLVGAVAGYGPPVLSLVGPWVLLALVLSGPFAFLLTLVVAMLVAAAVLVAVVAALLAVPYLLVRGLRGLPHVYSAAICSSKRVIASRKRRLAQLTRATPSAASSASDGS